MERRGEEKHCLACAVSSFPTPFFSPTHPLPPAKDPSPARIFFFRARANQARPSSTCLGGWVGGWVEEEMTV